MKLFNQVQFSRPKRNKFDLSHERKMSLQMAKLYPIMVQPILPGDSMRVQSEVFMRFAPMLAPIMHRVNVYTHYFFVPNRIVWNEWEEFITGGDDGTSAPMAPYIAFNEANVELFRKKGLADYMGVPPTTATDVNKAIKISALPFRAYSQIFNDYYRDQNLQDLLDFSKASGVVSDPVELSKIMTLLTRAWQKDYFTSCLPEAQKGPEVELPTDIKYSPQSTVHRTDGTINDAGSNNLETALAGDGGVMAKGLSDEYSAQIQNIESLGITINDLRRSSRLQEWLEKNARGGSRYVEALLSHWGVISDDARLQRAEFLGGGKTNIAISEVLQTSGTADETNNYTPTPQGNMAGHGIGAGASNAFKKKFKEHGYIIGIMSVLPTTVYQQGVPRHFSRFDKLEYPWPEFAHIGEQEVLNQEVYHDPTIDDTWMAETFGYQSRYAEEKYGVSTVHGDMRDELDYWHMSRIFNGRQALNEDFIKANPTKRIFAVEDGTEDELYCQLYHNISAIRPLPYFSNPRL